MADAAPQTYDVVIIGGGPTGVTLAVLLAKRGVSVIVAEKEAGIFPLPRAAHIDHEGMRILQDAGAAKAVMSTSRRANRYEFRNAKGPDYWGQSFKGKAAIRLLGIHLKSGCFAGSEAMACPVLLDQIPSLEAWIDAAARGPDRIVLQDKGYRIMTPKLIQ